MKVDRNNYDFITEDHLKLFRNLDDDVRIIYQKIKKDDKQVWRRAYIKAIFSTIEATVYYLRRFIKKIQENDDLSLSLTQQKNLDEFYFAKTEKRNYKKKGFRLPFLEKIVFLIELFAYSNYLFIKIDKDNKGWKCLESSLRIRNRITHPKKYSDVFITDKELKLANQAYKWFYDTIIIYTIIHIKN